MSDFPNWFKQTAKQNFDTFLPLVKPGKALQLGVFTGDATIWLLEHGWLVTDVDIWQGSPGEPGEIGELDFKAVLTYYNVRTSYYRANQTLDTYFFSTQSYLKSRTKVLFDFIYIDADHHAISVLEDAVNSWPLLKVGGLMAFDDATWRDGSRQQGNWPSTAIDAFRYVYANKHEQLEYNSQFWLRKTAA